MYSDQAENFKTSLIGAISRLLEDQNPFEFTDTGVDEFDMDELFTLPQFFVEDGSGEGKAFLAAVISMYELEEGGVVVSMVEIDCEEEDREEIARPISELPIEILAQIADILHKYKYHA